MAIVGRKDERPARFPVGQIELHIQLDPGANQARRVAVTDPARRSRWSARASKRSARCNISFRASENRHDLAA
jgi:hypothetical protein